MFINVQIEGILPVPDLPAEHARVLLLVSLYLGLDLGGGQLGLAAAQHARSDGASLLESKAYDTSDQNSGPVSLSCQQNIAYVFTIFINWLAVYPYAHQDACLLSIVSLIDSEV